MTLDAVRAMPNTHWLLLAAALKRRVATQERAMKRAGRGQARPSTERRLLP
jgi:hypothetical protein